MSTTTVLIAVILSCVLVLLGGIALATTSWKQASARTLTTSPASDELPKVDYTAVPDASAIIDRAAEQRARQRAHPHPAGNLSGRQRDGAEVDLRAGDEGHGLQGQPGRGAEEAG